MTIANLYFHCLLRDERYTSTCYDVVRKTANANMETALIAFYMGIVLLPGLLYSLTRRNARCDKSSHKHARFPGPRQYPLVGRVHDLPRTSLWLKLKEWADVYGPIYETSMMGQKFVVVSDEDVATELLVKHGNYFAGRAQIRALVDHKLGPTYVALQDRNGRVLLHQCVRLPVAYTDWV